MTTNVTGAAQAPAPSVAAPAPSIPAPAPAPVPAPVPVVKPVSSGPSVTERRAAEMARLKDALIETGLAPELQDGTTYLRINVDSYTQDVQIAVHKRTDDSVVRLIPPESLARAMKPEVLPRGVLLALVE